MYLLLIGTERCCDVVMMLLLVVLSSVCGCVRARACVCGGDGCVGDAGDTCDTGDTTNACTMYRVMGVCGCGCPFGRQGVRVVDRLMYSK